MEQVVLNLLNMFGTGKNVDTGETYLTFLGKELNKTIDDYDAVIKVAQKFNTVTGSSFGANEKWGIRGSFALGNINQNYNFSQYLDTDVKALERTIFQATQLKKQGKNTAEAVSEAFENVKTTISGTSVELEDFVKTIDLTNTSALTSIKTIVPQFISQMTKAVTVTTVLKGALKGIVGIAANLAVSAIASLAVGALVTVGEKAGEVLHNFKDNTFGKSFEEQKEQIDEMGQALDNTASSIDSYKSKITDLKDSIDSGTLSEQEAYQERKDLLEIQDELIQKYPEEASGIDLLNGSLETQLDLLNGITEAKARAYLSENNDIIQKSYEEMTKQRTYKSTGFDDYLEANSNDMSEIEKIAQKYADKGLAFAQYGSEKNGKARYDIEVTADVSQAKDAIDDFYNDVQKSNLISDDAKEALSSRLSQWSNEAKGIVDKCGDYAKQAAKYEIQLNDTWSKTYSDLTEAQESYNDAIAKNDDKAIAAALKKVKAAQEEFANTDIDNSFVQQYMQEQADQLNNATKQSFAQQALNEGFSQAAQTYKECSKNLADLNDKYKQYGNISNTNRDVLKWNTENLKKYKDVIASWKWDVGVGDYSTVEGVSSKFGEGDNAVEIAYTPMLQTDSGLVPLSANTMDEYINILVEKATDGQTGKINADKLLALDAEGLYLEVDGIEQKISGMVAGVEGQIVNGAKLTAADVAAIAGSSEEELQKLFKQSSDYVGHSMHDVQDSVLRWKTLVEDEDSFDPFKQFVESANLSEDKAEEVYKNIGLALDSIDKYGLQDIDILNIESLSKADNTLNNVTGDARKAIGSYIDLKSAAEELDIPLDTLVDTLVELGVVYSGNIKYTNEFTSSALTMAATASKAVSSVTSILNSQGTGVNVDTDSYSELIKDNAEYAAALQYSNGTMQLNREMTEKLTNAKVKESEAIIKVAYSQNQYKYQEVRSDLSKYTDEVRKSIETDADRLKQFDEEKAALESQSEALRENCRSLQMQYSALMQASSAYQDWLNAQNATESGDMYDSAIEAKKALAEGLKNGKIGTVKWQAASEFLIPDDYEGTAAEYIKKLNRYFKQASDGSDDGSGINNFITDSLKAGLMKQEKDGSIQILADKTTEDFAKALKLSPDAVQSIFGEMQEYGWTFDWGSMLGDPITNYQMQLEDLQDQMKNLDPDSEEWQVVNEQAEQLQSTLDGLMQRSGLDQLADVVADANEQGKGFSTEVQSAANALQDASRVQLAIDVSDAKDAITEAQKNLDSNKTLENYDALQKAEEEYNKLLQKQEQVGEPTQVEIDMYLKEDTSDGTTVSEKIENLQKAGLIQVPVESDDSQLQQAADELDTLKNKAADPVKITADSSDAMTKISNLGTAISNLIKDYTINIKVNQSSSNSGSSGKNQKSTPYAAQYHGINGAYGGAFAGGRTLVGELGNELVVNPHSGKWYTVGDNGAEFVNLPKDAIVFDHSKTKKLLDQGFIGGRGVALASGTAMDSGSPGRGSYVGGNGYKVGQDPRVKSTYKATTASTKATKDNTNALEENKKALEKQKTALEKQKDALEKESNKLKIYGQAAINEIEKRITALNKEKDAQDKVYESQIKELEKRKTALQKANDEEDRAIELAKAQDTLEKAKANKTVRIYNKNEGFVWRADQQEVSDAQTDLDDQKRQWKNDDVLQAVDDEIERINNLKDAYDESIEAQIEDLEAMKDKWNEVISLIGTSWEDYQLGLEAAAHFQNMSLDGMGKDLVGYKDDVLANMQEIGGVTDQIDSITESIEQLDEAIQNAKDSSSSGGGSGGSDASSGFGIDDGSGITNSEDDSISSNAGDIYKELRASILATSEAVKEYTDTQNDARDALDNLNLSAVEYCDYQRQFADAQRDLAETQPKLTSYIRTYIDTLKEDTEATEEDKAVRMQALADLGSKNSEVYTQIKQTLADYVSEIYNNTELTNEQRQSEIDKITELTDYTSSTSDIIRSVFADNLVAITENTDLSNEQRQSQIDSLANFVGQYQMSEDSIALSLSSMSDQLVSAGMTAQEAHSVMLTAAQTACTSMNASYDSVIAKLAALKKAQEEIANMPHVQTSRGEQVVSAGKGFAGRMPEYASGIIGAATTHIAITDEQGPEIKMRKPSAGNYSLIERGSSVIPAQPSANIWKMGIDPDSFISQHMPQRSIKSVEITQPDASGVSVSVGDIQMYGVNDVESFGRVIHERVGTIFAQEFSRR